MNIRRIIAEAIDKTLLVRCETNIDMELRRIDGMDTSTLRPESYKYLCALYNYASDIALAIKEGRLRPPRNYSPRGTTTTTNIYQSYNPYEKDKWSNQVGSFVRNGGANTANYLNQIGIETPMTNMVTNAWQTGYDTWNDYNRKDKYNKEYAQQRVQAAAQKKSPRRVTKRKPSGADLTTLCNQQTFLTYKNEYNQVNSRTGGELDRIRPLKSILTIIERDIKTALSA